LSIIVESSTDSKSKPNFLKYFFIFTLTGVFKNQKKNLIGGKYLGQKNIEMKLAKAALRKKILKQLSQKSKLSIENDSKEIVQKITKLEKYKNASHVIFYMPTPTEVDIRDLFYHSFKNSTFLPVF